MTTKTFSAKPSDVEAQWHVIDASGQRLGRLATRVAQLLQGKHKPIYTPHVLTGDFVVVVNASRIEVSGHKETGKVYYRHTGYPGGLRAVPLGEMLKRHPDRVIRRAVKNMLPGNTLARQMLKRLKVYGGDTHPHQAQVNAGTGARSRKEAAQPGVEEKVARERKPRRARAAAPKAGRGQTPQVGKATGRTKAGRAGASGGPEGAPATPNDKQE